MDNIIPSGARNFQKTTREDLSFSGTPFDPLSIMMYGQYDYGRNDSNGRKMVTIEPLQPGVLLRLVAECIYSKHKK